jgi:RimJ/RimL family protein N-acetyltransferase
MKKNKPETPAHKPDSLHLKRSKQSAQTTKNETLLQGKRLYLREVRQSDVTERYYRWLNDPEINQYLETRYLPQSLDKIANYVKHMNGKHDEPFFAICTIDGNEHIGNIKLGPVNWNHRRGEVSLLIGEKKFWGKDMATEAIGLITRFGFETLGLLKIEAGCYEANEASACAFEKNGYKREGFLRNHFVYQGKPTGGIRLGITAADYWNRQNNDSEG